jgi:hypothetical protein
MEEKMRRVIYPALLMAVVCSFQYLGAAEEVKLDPVLMEKVQTALDELKKVKVGMTRAELLKVMTTEGGLSIRKRRQYVYPKCAYIKIDVEFETVGDAKLNEGPEDKIVKISKPFLELTIAD